MSKSVDLLVWGATGITGSRLCYQIAKVYQDKIKWAIAGRNQEKLDKLKKELQTLNEDCKDLPIVVADIKNKESVSAMVRQTSLVVACAGPFPLYSDAVVEACVEEGSHFLDVTGETLWVRSVIDRFEDTAKRNNVKVVNFCGFDSVPADIGTLLLVNYAKKRYGRGLSRVLGTYSTYTKTKMPFSGGTFASIVNQLESSPEESKRLEDPYFLNPVDVRPNDKPVDQFAAHYDNDFGFWTAPFVMQTVNTRVVRRSCALVPEPYGKHFSYNECQRADGFLSAFVSTVGLAVFGAIVYVSFLRSLFLFAIQY